MVMGALGEYRVVWGEEFRFETIIGTLKLSELGDNNIGIGIGDDLTMSMTGTSTSGYGAGGGSGGFGAGYEEPDIWESRHAAMLLLNAITTATTSVDERIMLREEFGRRGLNEAVVVSVYLLLSCFI